ncbi:MAG: acetylornithine deacetylase [Gammaproteobacteria bacterium]|nr:acetylornithine deacetylase [Gammaproteobacteria bacterium]
MTALPETLTLIEELIAQPSVSSTSTELDQSNHRVINLLADWMESLGWQVDIIPVTHHKSNLVATLGCLDQPYGLVFSGHSDTVPFDEQLWQSDPFAVTERDQRLYGLGCTDMKAFFALAIAAARDLTTKELSKPLTLVATCDEESSMAGAKALVASGRKLGRYAIIGEPTDLRPVHMHKGIITESIRIEGQSGHSSDPSLGANALDAMHSVLTTLLEWRKELQRSYHNPAFKIPYPTLNLGYIHGGDNPNRICGHCETQIDIRPIPGMELDELKSTLRKKLQLCVDNNPKLSLTVTSLFDGLPPFSTSEQSDLLKTLEQRLGTTAESVAFGTEAPYFNQMGMETVVIGPGSINQAHQANEYLDMHQIQPGIDLLKSLIKTYCID